MTTIRVVAHHGHRCTNHTKTRSDDLFSASCLCGYQSPWRESRAIAELDVDNHIELVGEIVGGGTGGTPVYELGDRFYRPPILGGSVYQLEPPAGIRHYRWALT